MIEHKPPKDIHPKIAEIIQDFADEVGLEVDLKDIDKRLIDYSDQYVPYKPGVVRDTTRTT